MGGRFWPGWLWQAAVEAYPSVPLLWFRDIDSWRPCCTQTPAPPPQQVSQRPICNKDIFDNWSSPCSYHALLYGPGCLNPDSCFIQLFHFLWNTLPFTQENLNLIRKICCLTEAVFTLVLGGYRADVSCTFLEASPYGRRVYLRHNRARLLNELNSSELIVKLRNPMPPMNERENRVGRKRWKTPLRRANRIQDVKKRTSSGKYDGQSTVTSS